MTEKEIKILEKIQESLENKKSNISWPHVVAIIGSVGIAAGAVLTGLGLNSKEPAPEPIYKKSAELIYRIEDLEKNEIKNMKIHKNQNMQLEKIIIKLDLLVNKALKETK